MKIGINLVGVSGDGSIGNDLLDGGTSKGRDWKLAKDFIKSQIIDCWLPDHNVNVYCTTYNHYELSDTIDFYKPTKTLLLNPANNMQLSYIQSLEQLLDEDIDFIVSTRFDIAFRKKINTYPIDFNKFNYLMKDVSIEGWDVESETDFTIGIEKFKTVSNYNPINDTIFLFPKEMLPIVIKSMKELYEKTISNPALYHLQLHNMWIHLRQYLENDQLNCLVNEPLTKEGYKSAGCISIEDFLEGKEHNYFQSEYFVFRGPWGAHQAHLMRYRDGQPSWEETFSYWKEFSLVLKQKLNI